MSSMPEPESEKPFWNKLMKRTWKKYSTLKIFEEGYNRDYVYEKRENIPVLQIEQANPSNIGSTNIGKKVKKTGFVGGKPQPLLTMRGAIKFNMWKE